MAPKLESALLIVGHGSTVNPDSSAPTLAHAAKIRCRKVFVDVECAFWKEEPSLRDAIFFFDPEAIREVYVVPNFISEGYFTEIVIPRELELDGPVTRRSGKIIKYCEPVGNDPRMIDLLLHRAHVAAPHVPPEQTSLLIVGHGTSLNDKSAVAAKHQARAIREKGSYAEVSEAYMEEAPFIADWRKNSSQPNVVVVPFFIADGLHSYQDIPVLLGIESEPTAAASQQEIFRRNPYRLDGRLLYYASAIGTDPLMADIILDTTDRFDWKHL